MKDLIWSVAVLAAIVVFVAGLVQGRGLGGSARMGLGVLLLGFVAILVIGIAMGLLKLTLSLLGILLGLLVIFGLFVMAARAVRGDA